MNPEYLEFLSGRHNPHIDPQLHVWGWEVPVYLFLGGIVAGIMVLTATMALTEPGKERSTPVQLMPGIAAVLISLGMGALFLDLAHKLYVWRFYTAFQPLSPMSWGSWLLQLVYPALVLFTALSLSSENRDKVRGWLSPARGALDGLFAFVDEHAKAIIYANLALGAGLGVYTGLLLGTMTARMQWASSALGPLFLSSGISTGAAFMLLFPLAKHETHHLVRWDIAAILFELLFLFVAGVGHVTGGAPSRIATANFMGGEWTPWFWGLVLFMGLLVPLTLNTIEITRRLQRTIASPILVLIGGFALRYILVAAGQETAFSLLP